MNLDNELITIKGFDLFFNNVVGETQAQIITGMSGSVKEGTDYYGNGTVTT